MTNLLIIIVIILSVISLVQVIAVLELTSKFRKNATSLPTDKDNETQGYLALGFMIFYLLSVIISLYNWGELILPESASEHGIQIDNLMNISWGIIFLVFFIVQPLLFYFSFKYRGKSDRKATYVAHSNKLELIWTLTPVIVLTVLILYGLNTWISITSPEFKEEPIVIEVYSKQFQWEARYAGKDNVLGKGSVYFVEGKNTMGIDTKDKYGEDDIMVSEIHLPVNRPVLFKFRSQDVIHSAYMPHFRMQMNTVPGMITQFAYTPIITTEDMRQNPNVIEKVDRINKIRKEKGEEEMYEFDYLLLCNKLCGSAHYNMQMKIVVETQEEFNKWISEQKEFAEYMKN